MEKLINNEHLSNIKFAADCAIKEPDSIYSQEFFMLLDETFGSKGDYESPTQAVAVAWLINRVNELEQRAEAAEAALERESDIHIDTAASMREWRLRAEAAEAKLAELEKQEPVAYVHPAYLQAGALGFDASVGRLAPAQIPLFTRPAPAADLVPIGRVDRGEVSDNNEYPNARVVCLHDQADWENFPDGTKLFLRPAPAVGMDKPEPYAWLVHAPQGDYVERNPEVVAHLEGTGLTKCKPLYLDL